MWMAKATREPDEGAGSRLTGVRGHGTLLESRKPGQASGEPRRSEYDRPQGTEWFTRVDTQATSPCMLGSQIVS